ncbi:hypothetical protein E2C01_009661 [Portunus trituberculatus]|uniref:Uncharacterized protein n=1 Tax=Portunus trituberculatus TaxID=210409 RepID=A0A5B7D6D1_PORTR|nr:hypothetical protein [Portunus trituberculatus]
MTQRMLQSENSAPGEAQKSLRIRAKGQCRSKGRCLMMVGRNRKLKYSRNRFPGRAKPSEPDPEPVPRGIGRGRLDSFNNIGEGGERRTHGVRRNPLLNPSIKGKFQNLTPRCPSRRPTNDDITVSRNDVSFALQKENIVILCSADVIRTSSFDLYQ